MCPENCLFASMYTGCDLFPSMCIGTTGSGCVWCCYFPLCVLGTNKYAPTVCYKISFVIMRSCDLCFGEVCYDEIVQQ